QLIEYINPALCALPADHIALRCNQLTTAQQWHQALLAHAELISDKQINGRPIKIFRLAQPLTVGHWMIDYVELPYPSANYYPVEDWEHIELVTGGEASQFTERLSQLLPTQERLTALGITQKYSQPYGNNETLANPTVAFSRDGITVKLHP